MNPGPTTSLTRSELWEAVDAQRLATAELLASLTPDQWATPSLCSEWTVKEVAGHLAWQVSATRARALPGVIWAAAKARGDLQRAVGQLATEWAARRSTDELVGELRSLIGQRRHPYGVTDHEVLIDVIVHHQDIAIGLGRAPEADPQAAAEAAIRSWSLPARLTLPVTRRLVELRWRATDVAWDRGDGPLVEGSMAGILTALLGRVRALDHLSGPGVATARHLMTQ